MWSVQEWSRRSNEAAVCNARTAATILSQLRVERDEVELYVAELVARRSGGRTSA
jgi:hypothetical protein